ncbi:uncharacterized protein LOC120173040 isoform X1 [Hibiscus syriacus]|uniref:uncharacterized protein LOC120173040 isoform X1 n=1 Tax=Hibiscus syriacus TaxID=106335 RepID=UPI001924A673|nr:uncharacterized protein LOC120173040 isoform X1 [Hibiscus syriacus]XP_039036270.1 uncharacterized protein LOC120173040 isoform X1 [Hibiscus syriacus]
MDGLTKGFNDVVTGGGDGRDNEYEERDERSRSSWAQVVSGDHDNEHRPPSQRRKQEQSKQDDEGRQVSGSRPPQNVNFMVEAEHPVPLPLSNMFSLGKSTDVVGKKSLASTIGFRRSKRKS